MAYTGKVYNFERQDNYEDYLKALGMPADKLPMVQNYTPSFKMEKNGDSYTMSIISPEGTRTLNFTSGIEFDDMSVIGVPTKTTITVNGDTFTEVKRTEGKGSTTFKREFTADKLVITMTMEGWDGVSKRYYTV